MYVVTVILRKLQKIYLQMYLFSRCQKYLTIWSDPIKEGSWYNRAFYFSEFMEVMTGGDD